MAATEEKALDPGSRIKLLSAQADNVFMDKNIPTKRYFRSGIEMERMAAIYLDEGNLEKAFVLYMKYIILFVEKLPKHPQYNQADVKEVRKALAKVKQIFSITEKLKMTIKKTYEDEYQQWKEQEKKKMEEQEQIRKRLEAENLRKKQEEELALHKLKIAEQSRDTYNFRSPIVPVITPSAPHLEEDYPSAPRISDLETEKTDLNRPPRDDLPPSTKEGLAPIPKEDLPPPPPYSSIHIDAKAPDIPFAAPDFQNEVKAGLIPTVDRTNKPSSLLDRQISTPIGGLRRIYFPDELISKFLALASKNTRLNLETCGILTGKLKRNLFHITHLVIPKQTATSDSCTTTNEEEMFDVQDKYDLVTLGWIHTHPSQTSFLSSVDLHTQYAYQMLMPEAIAIVCAPKFDQVGVYRLTSDHGLPFIGSCSKQGFHPHPKEPPLFEESEHAQLDSTMKIQIIDLR